MVERVRNSAVAVGTTGVIIAPELIIGQRTVLVITNTSTAGQTITIQTGEQAQSNLAGIILYSGGSWSESVDSAFQPSNLSFWAVSSAASGSVAIQERIKTI